ncbi:MAG TPA: phosphate ABC transporter permease PstA [Thermomicrobiales bacterium]|nr:phosphate ABC transporter permease PstA [Thermomicrobiales bacterium]
MSVQTTFRPSRAALECRKDSSNLPGRKTRAKVVQGILFLATAFALLVLGALIWDITSAGGSWLSLDLLTNAASRKPEQAGLRPALLGTLWVIGLTALFAFPVGVGAAVYLEEYAPDNRWTRLLKTNISNLAGVPSVVYGLLGLGVFVSLFAFGRSVVSGALTMGLLILPVIIIASQEAIRAVPPSLRQAAFALGATRWQVARDHVIPTAMPGILTGIILSISRAMGETAPLLVVGAAAYVTFNPTGLTSKYTVLPMQIYEWARRPQQEYQDLAAAAIIVLLILLLILNATAIYLRHRFSKKVSW